MSRVPENEIKMLVAKSSGRCAYTGCSKFLITISSHGATSIFSGRIAHIVARSEKGPRGKSKMTENDRHCHKNLILLCEDHHTLIDKRPAVYTEQILLEMKKKHEQKSFKWYENLTLPHSSIDSSVKIPIPSEIQSEIDKAKENTDDGKYSDAIPILEKIMETADRSGNLEARVKVRRDLAYALYNARDDFENAERLFRDALEIIPSDNLDLKQNVIHGLGDMLLFSGRLDEAQAVIYSALEASKGPDKTYELVGALVSMSLLEQDLGQQVSGIERLNEAVKLLLQKGLSISKDEEKRNAQMLAVCYSNKAQLLQDIGDVDEALTFFEKAEIQHRHSGDQLGVGKVVLLRGRLHCGNADWEKGLDCFERSLIAFQEVNNPLWSARCLENISRFYATHEKWEEALNMMHVAVLGVEESGNSGELVRYLLLNAKLLREWKTAKAKESMRGIIYKLAKEAPEDKKNEIMSKLSVKMQEMNDEIKEAVRVDGQVYEGLKRAKKIAQEEHLLAPLAQLLLDEAYNLIPSSDAETKRDLIFQAIESLKEELGKSQFPKSRGHLMGRISALYQDLDMRHEAFSWLKKAGNVFEKSGDVFGLANYYGSLSEMYKVEGRLDDEIASYRKALTLIEERNFNEFTARLKINLASALRYRREFKESKRLLDEAEILCNRHHLKDLIPAIGSNRSKIEKELEAAQAPRKTLAELLESLEQLLKYRPEYAIAYLPFWYFAWKTEFLALVRSGPNISFMVVTDDVDDFLKFSAKYQCLADHFLMTTSTAYTVKVEVKILPIPPDWMFPATFSFMGIKAQPPKGSVLGDELDDGPPNIKMVGPAMSMPPYMLVDTKSDVDGEGHIMALAESNLPLEAISLMIRKSVEELIQLRSIWFPTDRFTSIDPFVTDLRISNERGVFPVYFDSLPTSESVEDCGGVQISVNSFSLNEGDKAMTMKWRQVLLKLTKLSKGEAQIALLDLPNIFIDTNSSKTNSSQIEVHLFEFDQMGKRVFHPVILVRE